MKKNLFLIVLMIFVSFIGFNIIAVAGEVKSEFKICIDPGHQAKGDGKPEPIYPGASFTKARVSSGTRGVSTKKWEYEVVLEASKILRDMMSSEGYAVVMTREENEVNISNKERAEFANKEKADLNIRIHCDSIKDSSKTGATILVPSKNGKHTKNIYNSSNEFAVILKKTLEDKGVKVNGIVERDDITGFNWSKVPTVILEMGFMSNYSEDRMLVSTDYQTKLMCAVKDSVNIYKNQKLKVSES